MNKKIVLVLMIAVFVTLGLVSCKSSPPPVASYKIGAVMAQTGNFAGLGNQSLEGMQAIVDDINEDGGINGIPLKLVVYDDKSEATEAALAAKKLIGVDEVHVLVAGTTTGLSMSVVQVANEMEIPAVIVTGTALFHDQLGKWGFTPMGSENDYIVLNCNYLSQELGISNFAALIENSGYGQGGKVFLPQIKPGYSLTMVEEQYFDPGASDLTPQITNIKNSKAEAIWIWGSSPTAAMVVKQIREMGILLPVIGTPPQATPDMYESFQQYYEMEPSFVVVTVKADIWQQLPDSDPDKAMFSELDQLIMEKYGHSPSMWNVLGAQMLLFIEDGLRRAKADPTNIEAARSQLRDALESTTELKLFTGDYTMSPTDHFGQIRQKHCLITFKNGGKVYLP